MARIVLVLGAVAAVPLYLQVGCGPAEDRINLKVTIEGQGTVTSRPGPIFCRRTGSDTGGVCTGTFTSQSKAVVLEAAPSPGWSFGGWKVSSTPSDGQPGTRSDNPARVQFEGVVSQTWTAVFNEGPPRPDAGTYQDAGADAGTDAGVETDAGTGSDAGAQADGGTDSDAGAQTDGGTDGDAGMGGGSDGGVEDAGTDGGLADGGLLDGGLLDGGL